MIISQAMNFRNFMEKILLTEKQAYLAMFRFLDGLQKRTNSDDLACILGSMDINAFDSKPMDPALWNDWIDAIKQIISIEH